MRFAVLVAVALLSACSITGERPAPAEPLVPPGLDCSNSPYHLALSLQSVTGGATSPNFYAGPQIVNGDVERVLGLGIAQAGLMGSRIPVTVEVQADSEGQSSSLKLIYTMRLPSGPPKVMRSFSRKAAAPSSETNAALINTNVSQFLTWACAPAAS